MAEQAALVTGASRGIGFAIAEALAADGYALSLTARQPDGLAAAADKLAAQGAEVVHVAADMGTEAGVQAAVALHRETYGRLDVLVNNAGVGVAAPADAHTTKAIDLQLNVNVRALILFYREALDLLQAGGGAGVINLASMTGKSPQPLLSVYSATKAAVIAYSEAMNRELSGSGVWSVAICPAFVDTDMTAFVRGQISQNAMIRTSDVVSAVRFVLSLSPSARVAEIVIRREGDAP